MNEAGIEKKNLIHSGKSGKFNIFHGEKIKQLLFIKKKVKKIIVVSDEGIIKQTVENAQSKMCSAKTIMKNLSSIIEGSKKYGDAGAILPKIVIVFPNKILDLSTIAEVNLMRTIIESEIKNKLIKDKVAIIWKVM